MDRIVASWRASGRASIVVAGHVGNNEAVAAAIAWRGLPANVVADDSSFPEIFEILRQQRESWGVHVMPWRNLRELFKVLRNKEIMALLVDWGYRSDGIPVRLFGAWTTLPGGTGDARRQDRRADHADGGPPDADRPLPRRTRTRRSASRRRTRRTCSGPPSGSRTRSSGRSRPRPSSGTASSPSGRRTPRRRPSWKHERPRCLPRTWPRRPKRPGGRDRRAGDAGR